MHWIHVSDEGKWGLRSAVIGMRGLSGNHSSKNLGRYVVSLCDRIGVLGQQQTKVNPDSFPCVEVFMAISCIWRVQHLKTRPPIPTYIRKTGKYFFVLFCTYLP